MNKQTEQEVELKHYLLGELGEKERWAVEERLFLDGEYLLRLQALEDELIDAYVYGDLPSSERDKVKTELLSRPGRREDLRFAQALRNYFDTDPNVASFKATDDTKHAPPLPPKVLLPFLPSYFRRNPLVAFSLAAAMLIMFAFAVWKVSDAVRRRNNQPTAQAPTPQPEQNAPTTREQPPVSEQAQTNKGVDGDQPLPSPQLPANTGIEHAAETPKRRTGQHPRPSPAAEQKPSLAVTILLLPFASVRGGGDGNVVTISPDVGTLNLQLPLYIESRNDSRYNATLQTNGKTIRTWSNLKPTTAESGRQIQVSVPTNLLKQVNYQLKLAAADRRNQDLITYTFQVRKK